MQACLRARLAEATHEPVHRVPQDAFRLKSVISTSELSRRPSRPPDYAAENRALVALAQEMAASPEGILQKLADTALTLCRAHSAGFSLLEEGDQKRNFHWRAIAGKWAPHLGGGTPRNFGPCGTVLDRNTALLFSRPERDFPYLGEVTPLLEDGLLIYVDGEDVGTIWVIAHDETRRFDAEDLRVMTNLGKFAAAAYQTVLSLNKTAKAHQQLQKTASALRDSKERFRRALEIETVGVIYFTVGGADHGRQRRVSQDVRVQPPGRSRGSGAVTPPEWVPHSERAVAEFIATGKTTPYEKEYFRKDGSRWWALFAATPYQRARRCRVCARYHRAQAG
jgi:PAS domain-containing protein